LSLIKRRNNGRHWMEMPFFQFRNTCLQTNVKEGKKNYTLEISIPGFQKDDLKLSVNDGYLTIEAEKKEELDDRNDHYIRRERRYGKVSRSFYIGDIDSDDIKASYKNGILYVVVPKTKDKEIKLIDIK